MEEHLVLDVAYQELQQQLEYIAAPVNGDKVMGIVERMRRLAPTLSASALLVDLLYATAALADPLYRWPLGV